MRRAQRRMTDDERATVRLLVDAYAMPFQTDAEIDAANAVADSREQDLPWEDFPRAEHLQNVALRAARIVEARRA